VQYSSFLLGDFPIKKSEDVMIKWYSSLEIYLFQAPITLHILIHNKTIRYYITTSCNSYNTTTRNVNISIDFHINMILPEFHVKRKIKTCHYPLET